MHVDTQINDVLADEKPEATAGLEAHSIINPANLSSEERRDLATRSDMRGLLKLFAPLSLVAAALSLLAFVRTVNAGFMA